MRDFCQFVSMVLSSMACQLIVPLFLEMLREKVRAGVRGGGMSERDFCLHVHIYYDVFG